MFHGIVIVIKLRTRLDRQESIFLISEILMTRVTEHRLCIVEYTTI